MSLRGLQQFHTFDLTSFLKDKRLAYLKSVSWKDGDVEVGSKVITQIIEDRTQYSKPGMDNFGVKVRAVDRESARGCTVRICATAPPFYGGRNQGR